MRALVIELGDPGLAGLQVLGLVFVPRKREGSKRKGIREMEGSGSVSNGGRHEGLLLRVVPDAYVVGYRVD